MATKKIPKVMVVGHARHGKDTVCEYLRDFHGLSFMSSSLAAVVSAIWPVLSIKYGYKDLDECFHDRFSHRAEWFELISEYTNSNLTRLADDIFTHSDIYCGVRRQEELTAISVKYDLMIIIVSAMERVGKGESSNSFTLRLPIFSNLNNSFSINNDSTIEDLYDNIDKLVPEIKAHLAK